MAASSVKINYVAHQCNNGQYPENTLETIEHLLSTGSPYGLEFDLRQSRDGIVILCHDEQIGSHPIHSLTLREIRSLSSSVPTLEEALNLILEQHRYKGRIFLDVKSIYTRGKYRSYPKIEEKIIRLLAPWRCRDRVIIISFDLDSLCRFRKLHKHICIGYLGLDLERATGEYFPSSIFSWLLEVDDSIELNWISLHRHLLLSEIESGKTSLFIHACHRRGILVGAWTVNEVFERNQLRELGMDAIVTDTLHRVESKKNCDRCMSV